MKKSKRLAVVSNECVACGCCVKVCPMQAITVPLGIHAEVDAEKCIGCGKCALACPAQVIAIVPREVPYVKAQAVV